MSEIVQKTEEFVTNLLTNSLDENFLYHNLKHTQRVVKSTDELIANHTLKEHEKEELKLAAWLHDTGYTKGLAEHEKASCGIAQEFLAKAGYSDEGITTVKQLIMATEMVYQPETLTEMIIRDADSSHFAQKSYWETTDYLREELQLLGVVEYSPKEWRDKNIQFFKKNHQFYTEYAKDNWENGKQKNFKQLIKEKRPKKRLLKKKL